MIALEETTPPRTEHPPCGPRGCACQDEPAAAAASVAGDTEPRQASRPACSACGFHHVFQCASKRGWKLLRCESCGTALVWPQPDRDELARLYSKSSGYFATAATHLETTPSLGANSVHERLMRIGVPGQRLLDVGCSNGQLIYHLRRLGWQVAGLDLNADAVALAQTNGLDVTTGDLLSCPWADASFDVIHMGDLIEHVPDPLLTLRQAFRLLREDGVLLIRTANAGCNFATSTLRVLPRLGLPWPHSEAPYHLHEFTPAGLQALAGRAGFDTVDLRSAGRTPFLYTLGGLGWFDDLKARMKQTGRYRFDWRLAVAAPRLIGAALMLLPFHLYASAADCLRDSGHTLTLLARRPKHTTGPSSPDGDHT